ncbi:MAG: hypothetical protein KatS3mg012_0900 [Gaiellaceae bacterium]|jgi:uncharacterized alkaline shock family protein YloU|nr:MAG: hypothetical protein KatS3mg012_0900 [Gaiellaceae bacterium]
MEDRSLVSPEVLARYAGDAALEVDGVAALADGGLQRAKAVAVEGDGETLAITLHLELEWGRSAREVGEEARRRVGEYLRSMAGVTPASLDVVFESVGSPPPAER